MMQFQLNAVQNRVDIGLVTEWLYRCCQIKAGFDNTELLASG